MREFSYTGQRILVDEVLHKINQIASSYGNEYGVPMLDLGSMDEMRDVLFAFISSYESGPNP